MNVVLKCGFGISEVSGATESSLGKAEEGRGESSNLHS